MTAFTIAALQRYRWLLAAAVLSFVIVLGLNSGTTFQALNLRGSLSSSLGTENVDLDAHGKFMPLRILAVGDSVTKGQTANGDNGWRLPLRNRLVQQGRSVDFIGTLSLGEKNNDNQHEGWGGMVISVIQEKIMADGILFQHPNLVLLQAGTNDNNEAFNIPPIEPHNTTIERMENLVDAILCEIPDTALIVAQIQDNTFGPNNTARVRQFNSEIPGLVAKKRAEGFQISMVDQFSTVGHDLDELGIHPSEEGYNKMARTWFDGIDSLPAKWIRPAREPHSKAPWAWYKQQSTACNALKGWRRNAYITDPAMEEVWFPEAMDMTNWTRIHPL